MLRDLQSRGSGGETFPIFLAIAKQLGYVAEVNFFFMNNDRSKRIAQAYQSQTLGSIPAHGYMANAGWLDGVIVYQPLEAGNQLTFTKLIEKRNAAKSKL